MKYAEIVPRFIRAPSQIFSCLESEYSCGREASGGAEGDSCRNYLDVT